MRIYNPLSGQRMHATMKRRSLSFLAYKKREVAHAVAKTLAVATLANSRTLPEMLRARSSVQPPTARIAAEGSAISRR